jgi:hypothetical protein
MTESAKQKTRKLNLTKEADVKWLTDELILTDNTGVLVEVFKMCIIIDAREQVAKAIMSGKKFSEIQVNTEAVLKQMSTQLRDIRKGLHDKLSAYDNLIQQIEEGV